MYTHLFGQVFGDFKVFVTRVRKDEKINIVPDPKNGLLGSFQKGDKLIVTITVTRNFDHECFTLDTKGVKTLRKPFDTGVYKKSLTVIKTDDHGLQVAPWPANMIGISVGLDCYNIGIFNQRGLFYLAVEEYNNDLIKDFRPGEVKWFSLLRGIGAVCSGNRLFDSRIHWSHIPRRSNDLHYLNTGELLDIIEVASTPSSTSFRQEIIEARLKK